jgi:ABC-type glycerol-3-phosphate transport system substrate-binding protein
MGGDPLNLRGPEAREAFREAFKRLWKLAPYLEPESKNIQFDTANNFLIANKVSMVDNWTYGIKVVMGVHQKQNIKVTRGLPGSFHVLGGDVLAIPTGISKERVERAIKLIEQLVAKETQRALAEKLFWAPVREDVYAELYAQKGMTEEYFRVIREVLRDAAIRPITPYWDIVQEVLSEALREVLKQAPARKDLETDAQIDAHIDSLLKPYIKKLQDIPLEIESCVVVERATTIGDECQVEVKTDISYRDLASKLNKDAATLAMVNGRGELDIVSPKKTQIILVPNKKG